jgi:hypothetical protein
MEQRGGKNIPPPPTSLDDYRQKRIAEGTLHRAMVPRYAREPRYNEFDHRMIVPIAGFVTLIAGPVIYIGLNRLAPALFNILP